jgi:hypothetical protein
MVSFFPSGKKWTYVEEAVGIREDLLVGDPDGATTVLYGRFLKRLPISVHCSVSTNVSRRFLGQAEERPCF